MIICTRHLGFLKETKWMQLNLLFFFADMNLHVQLPERILARHNKHFFPDMNLQQNMQIILVAIGSSFSWTYWLFFILQSWYAIENLKGIGVQLTWNCYGSGEQSSNEMKFVILINMQTIPEKIGTSSDFICISRRRVNKMIWLKF